MEKIKVLGVGQWGVKVQENPDLWFNYAKGSGVNKDMFKIGQEYTVEIVKNGNYSNIQSVEGVKAVPTAEAPKASFVKKPFFKKKDDSDKMTKEDWAAKDRSQMVGGRSHDAVELVKAAVNSGKDIEEVLSLYREALTGLLKLADEVK